MKFATWNLNGIRARHEQFAAFVESQQPDVICLQELKASPAQRAAEPSRLSPPIPTVRSVPELHRVHPRLAAAGLRTVTAGGESHPAPETGSFVAQV